MQTLCSTYTNEVQYYDEVVRSVEFIEQHLTDMLTVHDVAQVTGLSSWHFQRIFHAYVGETIGAYLRKRRLACALEELRSTKRKVIDIALDYQFGSSEAFSRAFKNEFNLSPQNYRSSKIKLFTYNKAALSPEQIKYLAQDITLLPKIREVDHILVIGNRASFLSPFAVRSKYLEDVDRCWKTFVARESEVAHKVGAIKVGIILGLASPSHHIHDDFMDYIAGTAVTKIEQIPTGFESFKIPHGLYACFEATGYHQQTQYLVDHVYSTWLPKSDYIRAEGPEFTWLDHRQQPLSPVTSKVEYFLPIQKK